jgi:hypothetical protein
MSGMRGIALAAGLVLTLGGCAADIGEEEGLGWISADLNTEAPSDEPDEESTVAQESAIGGAGVRMDVDFAEPKNPVANPEKDLTIHNRLHQLIKNTPDGGAIKISAFIFQNAEGLAFAGELVDASERRNVTVEIVQDGVLEVEEKAVEKNDSSEQRIREYLEAHLKADYVLCTKNRANNGSCIAKRRNDVSDGGRMHAKFALFSGQNDGSQWVTWVGSANLNAYSGTRMFNNALTVTGDKKLYDGMASYFKDLKAQSSAWTDDYYNPAAQRGYVEAKSGNLKVHMSPEQTYDLIGQRLDNVRKSPGCKIHVAQSHVRKVALLEKLEAIGCPVDLTTNAANLSTDAKTFLRKSKRITTHLFPTHDKVIAIYARYGCDGACPKSKIVLAGSHNLTESSNSENDELLTVLHNNRVYNRYAKHVKRQFEHKASVKLD